MTSFAVVTGGRHRGNPLAKEWINSGHNSRLNDEIRPILAKAENQEEEYSSKYATTFFTEVHLIIQKFNYYSCDFRSTTYQFVH